MQKDVADGVNHTNNQQNALPHLFLVAHTDNRNQEQPRESQPCTARKVFVQ